MSAAEVSTDPRSRVDVLYRTYRHDVYRSLLRDLGSPADADDCTQTVFLSAMRALDRGCRPHAARAWLLAIAKNVARKAWRDRRSAVELEPDAIAADDRPDESRRELFAVLETLPSGQRTALVLHELYGLEYTEISELTDQTVAGVETSVFRARKAVRTAMRDGGAVGHDDASRLLRRLVDGKLTRNEREAVVAHVRSCSDCTSVEAELRSGKGRQRFVLWVLSVPSAIQRLAGLLQASPARGLGAVGVCALGLAAVPGDQPAAEGTQPVARAIVVAERESAPHPAAAPQPVRAGHARPAAPRRQPTPALKRAVPPAGRPAVARSRRIITAPVAHPSPKTPTPAAEPARRPSANPQARHASPKPRLEPETVTGAVPAVPAPIDAEGTLDDVVAIVGEAASGDLSDTGAAVDTTVGGVLEHAGAPAPPPVAEPLAGTVGSLAGTVEATAREVLQPLAPAPPKP